MYATVLIMRWYEVQNDMRVDWCSVADAPGVAATARSAVGRTAVTSGPEDAICNRPDGGTGKEAEGFRTMVLPELGEREVKGSKRSQGKDFTPERRSAHIVGFRPLPGTSRAVQRTGVMPLTIVLPELGGREVRGSKLLQGRYFTPERRSAHIVGFRPLPGTSRAVQRTGVMPLTIDQPKVGVNRGQRCRFSAAAAHAISSFILF